MLAPIRFVVWLLSRLVLSLRYRLRVTGLREAAARPGPYLILPNHPGYMDPANVFRALWGKFRMRPMLAENNFRSPVLAPFGWLMRAINVPETDRASAEAKRRAEAAVGAVIEALQAGENVVLWPAGTLSRDGAERLGAARAAAEVLKAVPHATVVLVRTRGLWGSSFGWARGGKPLLVNRLLAGVGWLLLNLLVFSPRRSLHVHVEAFGPGERPEPTREELNPWLERWYEADGGERPTFVPYHPFIGPREYNFPPPVRIAELDPSKVKPATFVAVEHILADRLKRDLSPDEYRAETNFAELGLDSLESAEVALAVEQRFGFTGEHLPTTVGQLWALAEGLVEKGPPKPPPTAWFAAPSDTGPFAILGETIPEAFLNRAALHPKDIAVADDIAGVLTYESLVVGALTMAERFRKLPGENVGLLLPASVAADVAFFGLHLAGKLPVALNWTTGPAALEHAVRLTGLTHVVTSKSFIDRTHIAVSGAALVFLEDLRASASKWELLRRLLAVRFLGRVVRRKVLAKLSTNPHRPAVVLFTSGSEKAPKAVPLTHANLIADQRAAIPPQNLTRTDTVLGFLPMFHSFGLALASLFPILAGGRVVHHPDPTDAAALARKLAGYRPTILIGTPTFVGLILNRCRPGDLDSLRLVVVGAEKCPEDVFARVAALAPRATVLEGYGVTECGPCVSVNPVEAVRHGTLGRPLPGVEVCVTALDTGSVLPAGETGMLLVSGPTVFPGYLGTGVESPFRELDGKRWYVSGDLAALDGDGYILFRGRLKRFLKVGGEMVSLPALEEPFTRVYLSTEDGPRAAVEGVDTPGDRRIVLFTTMDVTLREANALLVQEGFRGVMRLDEVRKVERIPILGTGKTDYKALRAMIV
jgi:acyl-CoA synthetase (AMP-forming)/AMP-acid ligase II/1-acyl-sn-glycerol-3-phosphate acyltransferase/acyl carrier protein